MKIPYYSMQILSGIMFLWCSYPTDMLNFICYFVIFISFFIISFFNFNKEQNLKETKK